MDLFGKKEILKELYGFEFPDSLFHLHAFFAGLSKKEAVAAWDTLGMGPCGVLGLLDWPQQKLRKLRPKLPMVLHYRFFHDPPEFFTCLGGDFGRHWGLLLDEPDRGFRGVASFYKNDNIAMMEHAGLFAVVLDRIDWVLEENEGLIEDDPDEEETYLAEQEAMKRLDKGLTVYMRKYRLPRNEGRPDGVESDTGLSLVAPWPANRKVPTVLRKDQLRSDNQLERERKKALAACNKGEPLPALALGRSLHYWAGREWSEVAAELLRNAYLVLDRPELVRVLDVHHQHRDLPNVDLLRQP